MGRTLLGEPGLERVALLRALKVGDLLCAVPAFRALRAALPRAAITLVGLPWARTLVEHLPAYLDDHLTFPGWPGLPEQRLEPRNITAFLAEAQRRQFDLVIQMHGNGTLSNPLAVLLGGRMTAGFFVAGAYCPDPDAFVTYPEAEPEVRRHLRLMEHLGASSQGEQLEFWVTEADRAELRRVAPDLQPGSYACLHAGSRSAPRWPTAYFAAVGDLLAGAGVRVILTGTREEADVTGAVAAAMQAPALDLADRTSLGAVAALIADARLLLCNDTGVSHLAAALDVPSVVTYLDSDVERWAPHDRQRHRVIRTRREPDEGRAAVVAAVEELLSTPFGVPAKRQAFRPY